jgi:hypothetical protein
VLVCSERRAVLAGCWWLVCSERSSAGWWLISRANRLQVSERFVIEFAPLFDGNLVEMLLPIIFRINLHTTNGTWMKSQSLMQRVRQYSKSWMLCQFARGSNTGYEHAYWQPWRDALSLWRCNERMVQPLC